jgi:MerR family mercuric resistance operon transcriptional regulator
LQNGAQFDPQPAINPNRLPAPGVGRTARNVNSYRNYTHKDVDRMRFVTRGRELGFSLDEIRSLLRLAADSTLSCAEADQVARRHLVEVRARIAELRRMAKELERTIESCAGGSSGDCTILGALHGTVCKRRA